MTEQHRIPPRSGLTERTGYRVLITTAPHTRTGLLANMWNRAWSRTQHMSGSTRIRIHGVEALVNTGYAYPAFARRWPTYNDPLVQIVHSAHMAAGHPITIVDVGAAVGDTVLLIMERSPGEGDRYLCFEPDPEFLTYLTANLGGRDDVRIFDEMLADVPGEVADLVRTHSGTASAQGTGRRLATTLDQALEGEVSVDVLKTDTDGFDGLVLAGARHRLADDRPAVIFEWHPILAESTGQDWRRSFEVLDQAGYRWFVWFTKEGEFSHIDDRYQPEAVEHTARVCLDGAGPRPDWHYDVVALHESSPIDPTEVAALRHAVASRTP